MPQKKNPRGRFLEHVGWWQPRQGLITQREIVLNKERVRYWLAMGAQPSETVQKFLSYYDLAPKPLIKYGYKTVYERPAPVVKDYMRLNPYKIVNFDYCLHQFVEQEEEVKILKQERMKNELVKQIGVSDLSQSLDPEVIQTDIKLLQDELQVLSSSVNQVDLKRRQLIVKRINHLFPQLIRAEKYEAYKQTITQGKSLFKDQVGQDKYLKRSLETARVMERLEKEVSSLDEKYEALKPISKEEFKDFLLTKGFVEAKADKTVRKYFIEHPTVLKIHAIEATENVPEIEHTNQLHLEHYRTHDQVIFPLPNAITPRPNIKSYDAADYYEIPRVFDPTLQGNKGFQSIYEQLAYSLPGVTDKLNPVKNQYPILRFKNVMGGKKPRRERNQNLPPQYRTSFSTINSPYMSQLQYLKYTGIINK